ncbi:MAG: hypothetical protein IT159_08150 [Bryobacterales bacterium]|nr:hypothetical protein [Bryobacterales bacterium]
MKSLRASVLVAAIASAAACFSQQPPRAGKVELFRIGEVKPGLKGLAWTVFQGSEPEPVPVEIIGVYQNAGGPRQDIILAKLGGKAERTNVAGGMSGSPVYIEGRLAGAISTRISVLSPDAICGITPIELMLEVSELDESRPAGLRPPAAIALRSGEAIPGAGSWTPAAGAALLPAGRFPVMTPIETPLAFSGFQANVLRDVSPIFQELGLAVAQGGAASTLRGSQPGAGWENALHPGEVVTAILVSGDMTVSGQGTVTYNDGRRVLAFGHSLLNLGRVDMPMSKGEVLMTLASSLQPNKFANATEVVGALKQDRHSGVLGVLGEQAEMIPVTVEVRSLAEDGSVRGRKSYQYSVGVIERLTPNLLLTTLYNTISAVNEFGEGSTFRLNGKVELDGGKTLSLATMQSQGETASQAPLLLANWVTDRFNRLFTNAVTTPRFRRVDVSVDVIPERRTAFVESAWIPSQEVSPGDEVLVKVFLRPYRGPLIAREIPIRIPSGLPAGQHRILLSDADTLNRLQAAAGRANRFIDLDRSIALINQERTNNRLYASILYAGSTVYYDDKVLPSLPASVLAVLQPGGAADRSVVAARETALEQASIPFEYVVSGSASLTFQVK